MFFRLRASSRLFQAALPLIVCLLLSGCNPRAYRRGAPFMGQPSNLAIAPVIEPQTAECSGPVPGCALSGTVYRPQKFSLAYIEFDDAGEFWSIGNLRKEAKPESQYPPSQLELASRLILSKKDEARTKGVPLTVLGFVHGWENNASANDEHKKNLQSFKNSLQFLAVECPEQKVLQKPCPVVVGIFFAWRGRSVRTPWLNVTSYRNRRDAANRVGGTSMTEAVMQLALTTKGAPGNYNVDQRCSPEQAPDQVQTLFLLVGHSFGGRVLEHGITQPMLALLLERRARAQACVDQWKTRYPGDPHVPGLLIIPPVDLIALINPADDALEAKSMIEAFKRAGLEDRQFDHPIILSVKSDGDHTTGWIMKVGQTIVANRPAKRVYDHAEPLTANHPAIASACEQGQLGERGPTNARNQAYYYRRSPGGIDNMASHQITEVDIDATTTDKQKACLAKDVLPAPGSRFFWGATPDNKGGQCFRLRTAASILTEDQGRYTDNAAREFYSCSPAQYGGEVPVWNDTPYYIMHTPASLIANHDDIFEPGVYTLMQLMIQKRQAVPAVDTPVSLSTPASRKK